MLKEKLNAALEATQTASDYILKMWNNHQASTKTDGSIVTNADIEAEGIIRRLLNKNSPEIKIYGEELGDLNLDTERYWIIDPIDGTRWYNLGLPVFGSLIAYVEQGEPILGVISLPATQEMIYARQGGGCFYWKQGKQQKIQVSNTVSLNQATVSLSGLHGSDLCLENGSVPYKISRLPSAVRGLYFTGDCVQHALVARGKVDAAVDTIMKPWDMAAIIPCVREAGGYVGSLEGRMDGLLGETTLLSCSTEELGRELTELLRP